jgi:hypothetical protein
MYFNVTNSLMLSKLIMANSMGDIVKEISLSMMEKLSKREANYWHNVYYLN